MPKGASSDSADTNAQLARDYARVEQAIVYLIDHQSDQPELDAVADHIGLSPFHTQRLFTRWAGSARKSFSPM